MTSRRINYATIILALFAGFAGGSLSRGSLWAPTPAAASAAAREGEGEDDAAQKWEYCAVLKAQYPGSVRGEVYWISYFRGERVETVNVEAPPGGNAFSKAVNRLGLEGWEMVGQGPLEVRTGLPGQAPPAVFFKRRRDEK